MTDVSALLALSDEQNVVVMMPANHLAYRNTFLMKNDLTVTKYHQQALYFGTDLLNFFRTCGEWAFNLLAPEFGI